MLSSVLLGSHYSFPLSPPFLSVKFSPCIAEEVLGAFANFQFSPRYQPYVEPPQLHIRNNLSIDTTVSPPNPRSTGMHHKWVYKLRHCRLEQPHWVGSLWCATTLISWQLWPTTSLLGGIVHGYGDRIVASYVSFQMDTWQEICTYCENMQW